MVPFVTLVDWANAYNTSQTANQVEDLRRIARMSNTSKKPLRQNPFTTYRDPQTGQWVVVTMSETQTQPSLELENECMIPQ